MATGRRNDFCKRTCHVVYRPDSGAVYGSRPELNYLRRRRMVPTHFHAVNAGSHLDISIASRFLCCSPLSSQLHGTSLNPTHLLTTSVALVVLFADSLNALIPHVSSTQWKLFSFLVFIPLSFVSLNI